MLRRVANVAEEAVAVIVASIAETRAAAHRFQRHVARVEPQVRAAHAQGLQFGMSEIVDLAAIAAAGDVDAVIEIPNRVVHYGLHIEFLESREELLADVGLAIAFR